LDPDVDPALLHLYAEAIERPMQITGAAGGPGGFGPQAAICFYGTGIDTPYSGNRIYWLAAQEAPGERIQQLPPSTGSNQPSASFPFSVEIAPKTTYFPALITADGNNFFGPLVSTTPTDETLQVSRLDTTSTEAAYLDVVLQGIIQAFPHDVTVALNGTTLGDIAFTGQAKGKLQIEVPAGLLQDGANTVTLTAQNGEYDTSLVQSIRLTYAHTYIADADKLRFTGRAGDEISVTGFTSASISVFDITVPGQPVELTSSVVTGSKTGEYAVEVQVPWPTTNSTRHTLLALGNDRISSPAAIYKNHPSQWHRAQAGSELVIVSHEAFMNGLEPILQAHEAEGISSTVIAVDDLYDEFTFGQRNPFAIRDFLQAAAKVWHEAPKYLLLNGRASLDPRNYLGLGYLDLVPTKIVATPNLMTASDDWFSDFNDSGMPTIATGRLPVSTLAETHALAEKIGAYEGKSTNGAWTSQALMVADVNDTENFTQDSLTVQAKLPSSMQATDVFASSMGLPEARQAILNAINSGELLVNYAGHGSEDEWSGDDLFDNSSVPSLTNGSSLPVFLIMNCLNGFFQDPYEDPLAVSLVLAPNGGAVAVLASSGLNQSPPQTTLDELVVEDAMGSSRATLGDAIVKGKAGITDLSVRKTYNLLGDPAMRIKAPASGPAR
jgi:hypothetical protein